MRGQDRTINLPVAEPQGSYSNITGGFFNVRGTWYLSQHVAPLWLAGRFSVLWLDDPNMQHATGTKFHHFGQTTQFFCGQSTVARGQGSERYLVALQDKLNAAAGLFGRILVPLITLCHPDPRGAWSLGKQVTKLSFVNGSWAVFLGAFQVNEFSIPALFPIFNEYL